MNVEKSTNEEGKKKPKSLVNPDELKRFFGFFLPLNYWIAENVTIFEVYYLYVSAKSSSSLSYQPIDVGCRPPPK